MVEGPCGRGTLWYMDPVAEVPCGRGTLWQRDPVAECANQVHPKINIKSFSEAAKKVILGGGGVMGVQ